jgi:hypothetical protein
MFNGGFSVNIMIDELTHKLSLPLPKPTQYNFRIVE